MIGFSVKDRMQALVEGAATSTVNIATTPLAKARAAAEKQVKDAGKSLNDFLPDFDENYMRIQKATKVAMDVPRIEMPVIEPPDMKKFHKDLAKGKVDIFAPYAKGRAEFPKNLTKQTGKEWIGLGIKDGKKSDDVVPGKWTSIPVSKLKPTQSQIWLTKVIANLLKFGLPGAGSNLLKKTVIVSRDGYILDGHHRYGQAMMADPSLKLKALFIPLPIKTLLKIGRSYGNAVGNKQKA